ncbi:MAG: Trafficking protein particle complex subunit 33 [Bogoriella megaspora]|nr:MAG: Trafficking protein particle complex subunit 33 [Bogoriella megaspora]
MSFPEPPNPSRTNTSNSLTGPRDSESHDPHSALLNVSCFDLLLIELVPLAFRMANEQAEREAEWIKGAPKGKDGGLDEEEVRENAHWRLDMLGYRVGLGIVERFSRDKPRFTDTLDVIKFLCKDIWTIVFRKQIDNLKTNHRGIYVLTDGTFKPLGRMSTERGEGALTRAQPFLWFPSGIIRGALAGMGITASVQGETSGLPGATFQIKTAGSRP